MNVVEEEQFDKVARMCQEAIDLANSNAAELAEARRQLAEAAEEREVAVRAMTTHAATELRLLGELEKLASDYNAKSRELAEARRLLDDVPSDCASPEWTREEENAWQRDVDRFLGTPEASSAEARDETSTALKEEIKELEADLRSSEAEENAAWDEADKWQERAEYAGNAVRLLLAWERAVMYASTSEEVDAAYFAVPKWMRREIEK